MLQSKLILLKDPSSDPREDPFYSEEDPRLGLEEDRHGPVLENFKTFQFADKW